MSVLGEFINVVMPFYSKKVDDELIPLLWIPIWLIVFRGEIRHGE